MALIQRLFDDSAPRYARDVVPLLAPLTADFLAYLVRYTGPGPADRARDRARDRVRDRVLDLGTGTGLVAWVLAAGGRRVVGLDLSGESLRMARHTPGSDRVSYVQGDLTRPPFAPGSFGGAVASFGLNTTDPARSLPAIRRLLVPGGWLAIQEWGPASPLDRAVSETLAEHLPDDPVPAVAALRDQIAAHPARWQDQLQDADDYAEWLADYGFTVVDTREETPVGVRVPSVDAFMRYALARADRHTEIAVLDAGTRAACLDAIRARLVAFAAPDGSLAWEPVVFRALAELSGYISASQSVAVEADSSGTAATIVLDFAMKKTSYTRPSSKAL
ncbi:MAG: methyltransferase domain-containing protein [Anaerolineae bacterium]|nr:methyltransferase domain-containing protein [Anaerolineae bacterium]